MSNGEKSPGPRTAAAPSEAPAGAAASDSVAARRLAGTNRVADMHPAGRPAGGGVSLDGVRLAHVVGQAVDQLLATQSAQLLLG